MIKSHEALCRYCRTLASPVCDCKRVASKQSSVGLIIYTDDLSQVSLTNTWKTPEGKLVWLEETDLLNKARVSTVFDIHFTKD